MPSLSAVIVTGASGVLGTAITQGGIKRGWTVLTTSRGSRSPAPGCDAGINVPGTDLSTSDGARRLGEAARMHLAGQRFAVVNCVGSFPGYRAICDINPTEAAEIMRENYLTVYNVAHGLLPLMCEAGGGHFVAFTSHSRYQAFPLMAAFDAAKAAVVQLVKHVANENASHGIAANTLALATVYSESERRLKPNGDHSAWLHPEHVADYVFWLLAAPDATMNGNELHLFRYSDTYFHSSYFQRVEPRDADAE